MNVTYVGADAHLIKFAYAIMPILSYYKLRDDNKRYDKKVRSVKGPPGKGATSSGQIT